MRRETKLATAGVACVVVAIGLFGFGHTQDKPPTIPPPPKAQETITVTAMSCAAINGKADRKCTPGAINPWVTQANIKQTICKKYWTDSIRPSTDYTSPLRDVQMLQYGLHVPSDQVREDHLISLEIGGAPRDHTNLWPQLTADSYVKDREEGALHHRVCSGEITLADAQRTIVEHWTH